MVVADDVTWQGPKKNLYHQAYGGHRDVGVDLCLHLGLLKPHFTSPLVVDQVQIVFWLSWRGFAKTCPIWVQLPQVRRLVDATVTHDQSVMHSWAQTNLVSDPPFDQSDSHALRIPRHISIQNYRFHFFVIAYYFVYNWFFSIVVVFPLTDALCKFLYQKAPIRMTLLAHFMIKRH